MNNPKNAPGTNAKTEDPGHQLPSPPPTPLLAEHNKTGSSEHHSWTWILIVLVVVLAGGALFLLRGKKPEPRAMPPVSITTTNVHRGDINVAVTALGAVTPVYTASISPRVDGQVIKVNFTEGQMVNSNDLLVEIDPGPYQAAYDEASGQLARDKALLEGANVDLKRYQAAFAKKAVPQQQVDDQLALVHQDEGAVKLDEGQLEAAKVNLNYCFIRAPFAGRVGLRLVDPGNVVHAANTNAIVVVAQLQPITVEFNVAEDYLPQIIQQLKSEHLGDLPSISDDSQPNTDPPPGETSRMTVEAWDRSDETVLAAGKVLALDNLIDSATGTIRIRAVFDNADLSLFPNQFVNAKLIIKTLHGLPLVPTDAIQHNPEGAFVYVVTNAPDSTNQAVAMRNITTGVADGDFTAVPKGLKPGDVIAMDNFNKLGDGVKVVARQPGGGRQGHGHKQGGAEGGSFGKKPNDADGSGSKDSS